MRHGTRRTDPYAALPADEIAGIRRVVILCWGLIGDVLIRVAIIEALRLRLPQAHLTIVVDPASQLAVQHHPALDEVYVFRRNRGTRGQLAHLLYTVRQVLALRRRCYDLSVNLYSGGSSPFLSWLIHARWRLGFAHTAALRRVNNIWVTLPSQCSNWTKALCPILGPLGVVPAQVRRGTSFYYGDEARSFATAYFQDDTRTYVAINLGARTADKRWAIERFVGLAKAIFDQHGLYPLVFTNPGMEELSAQFVTAYAGHSHYRQVPLISLTQVAAVMDRCAYVVSGDTSLLHMAYGLKRPTLALFTYTRPEVVAPEDCLHVDCFVPDARHTDACGNPLGSADIPLRLAIENFAQLVALARESRNKTGDG